MMDFGGVSVRASRPPLPSNPVVLSGPPTFSRLLFHVSWAWEVSRGPTAHATESALRVHSQLTTTADAVESLEVWGGNGEDTLPLSRHRLEKTSQRASLLRRSR